LPALDRQPGRRQFSRGGFVFAIIRLGEGISATGSISEAAIDRAIVALSICSDKIRYRKARRLRLIATEACRAAANAESFRRGSRRRPASGSR